MYRCILGKYRESSKDREEGRREKLSGEATASLCPLYHIPAVTGEITQTEGSYIASPLTGASRFEGWQLFQSWRSRGVSEQWVQSGPQRRSAYGLAFG